ncbi:MAG: hypothetical protein ABR909_09310 [Candidatus Bathyarchaeia archaeon]|jgi:hypothetical protein
MEQQIGVAWKIKVKLPTTEIEVVGMNSDETKAIFKELEATYLSAFVKK